MGSFTATYGGTCSDCGERIKPGDDAAYNDGELVHRECPQIPAERTPILCTTCFVFSPCACEDGQ